MEKTHQMQYTLLNAFSLNMLVDDANLSCRRIHHQQAESLLKMHGFVSAVGHKDFCSVLEGILHVDVPCVRSTVKFSETKGFNHFIVAQYTGPRLPEGATELPKDAVIEFWIVSELLPDERF